MTTFLLIRHGVTDITGRILTGRTPGFHLNEAGRKQAYAVSERLAGSNITGIYSSPIERTIETATPLAARLGREIQTCEAFTEVDFGAWTGENFADLQATEEWRLFNRFRSSIRPPSGESILDLQQRTVPELDRLRRLHPQQTIAIFSHGDPIRATLLHYLGMPGDFLHRLDISPASVSIVEVHDTGPRVLAVNVF